MGTSAIALCGRCRRDTLPQLAQPSWHREKHRASASEREPEPSTAAQKAMRKKERHSLRKQTRAEGFFATVRTFLALKNGQLPPTAAIVEDCEHCQKLQNTAA